MQPAFADLTLMKVLDLSIERQIYDRVYTRATLASTLVVSVAAFARVVIESQSTAAIMIPPASPDPDESRIRWINTRGSLLIVYVLGSDLLDALEGALRTLHVLDAQAEVEYGRFMSMSGWNDQFL